METDAYNGWKNWETWQAALWLQNDEGLYNIARHYVRYSDVVAILRECGDTQTPDGLAWDDARIDHGEMDAMLSEME